MIAPEASRKRDCQSGAMTATKPPPTTTTAMTMLGGGGGRGIVCHDLTAYTGAKSVGLWQSEGNHTWRRTAAMYLLDCMGGMTTPPPPLLRRIKDHDGGLSLFLLLCLVFLPDASPTNGLTITTAMLP